VSFCLLHVLKAARKQVLESLDSIPDYTFEVYDEVVVDPTEESWFEAIE
jgi:hypothetical protein